MAAKMTKMHIECQKYPKTLKNNENAPQTALISSKTSKWWKYHCQFKNKHNALATFENDWYNMKLSQNTLNFLDFRGVLVDFKLFCTVYRIFGHFAHFSNVEVHFLIVLDFGVNLVIYEVSRLESLF